MAKTVVSAETGNLRHITAVDVSELAHFIDMKESENGAKIEAISVRMKLCKKTGGIEERCT